MKYYIVSEEELNQLASSWAHLSGIDRAEAACRARPVPEWATHFARITYDTDDDNNPLEQLNRFQFIERMGRK
jgi:hypothetical protein